MWRLRREIKTFKFLFRYNSIFLFLSKDWLSKTGALSLTLHYIIYVYWNATLIRSFFFFLDFRILQFAIILRNACLALKPLVWSSTINITCLHQRERRVSAIYVIHMWYTRVSWSPRNYKPHESEVGLD